MITWAPLVGSHLSSCYHFKPKKLALLGVTLEIQGYEALTLGTSLKCTQLVPAPIPPCTRDEPLLTVGLLTPVWTGPPPFAELQARVCGLAVGRNPHQGHEWMVWFTLRRILVGTRFFTRSTCLLVLCTCFFTHLFFLLVASVCLPGSGLASKEPHSLTTMAASSWNKWAEAVAGELESLLIRCGFEGSFSCFISWLNHLSF